MKKTLIAFLVMLLCLALAACGSTNIIESPDDTINAEAMIENTGAKTKTVYCYYRWVAPDGNSAATYNMGSGYTYQSIELDYELESSGTTGNGQVARYGEYVGDYGTHLKNIWYKSTPFTKTVTTQ